MIRPEQVEHVARALFPEDYHDGSDCRGEIGKEGEPCGVCAGQIKAWRHRKAEVKLALESMPREPGPVCF